MRQAAALALALLLAVAGCGSAGEPRRESRTEAKKPERPVVVSLGPSYRDVGEGEPLRLRGDVEPAGTPVALYADPYPFGEWRRVRRLRTDRRGRFHAKVRPVRETRYVARTEDGRAKSSTAQISVLLFPRVEATMVSPTMGRVRVTWKAKVPLRPVRGARACAYRRTNGRWIRRGCGAVERAGGGRLVASIPFRLAGTRVGDRFTACSRVDVARGFSAPYVQGCAGRTLEIL